MLDQSAQLENEISGEGSDKPIVGAPSSKAIEKTKNRPGRKPNKAKEEIAASVSTPTLPRYLVLNEQDSTYREIKEDDVEDEATECLKNPHLRIVKTFFGVIARPQVAFGS
jgi:hypothetical protein